MKTENIECNLRFPRSHTYPRVPYFPLLSRLVDLDGGVDVVHELTGHEEPDGTAGEREKEGEGKEERP